MSELASKSGKNENFKRFLLSFAPQMPNNSISSPEAIFVEAILGFETFHWKFL